MNIMFSDRIGLGCLRKLISIGVDPQIRDANGRTPLLWAASAGSTDAILALVNHGADILSCDEEGLTALHCAASRGQEDCITILISLCGADVGKTDVSGCTPLFYAVTLGHVNVAKILLDFGALTDVQDKKGRTPAHGGAAKGQLDSIILLFSYKANLWIKNDKGNLPFHEAIMSGRQDLVRYFLSQKPEAVHFDNNDGKKPIHMAATLNNSTLCSILIEFQSEINPICRSSKNRLITPLDVASRKGNRVCAKFIQLEGGLPAAKLVDKHSLQRALDRAYKEKKLLTAEAEKNNHPFISSLNQCSLESNQNEQEEGFSQNALSPDLTSNLLKQSRTQSQGAINKFPQFSPSNFEKRSFSYYEMSDSDSESDYPKSKTRRKKIFKKKVSSDPYLSRRESSIDFDFGSMNIGDVSKVFKQHRRVQQRHSSECFPDIIPSEVKASESLANLSLNSETNNQDDFMRENDASEMKTINELDVEELHISPEEQFSPSHVYEESIEIAPFRNLSRNTEQPNLLSRRSIFHQQKLIRKSMIEQALQTELNNLREAMDSAPKMWEGVVVKRHVKEYNAITQNFVGTKTYNGNLRFKAFEEHITEELQKFQSKTHLPVLKSASSRHNQRSR